MYEPISPDVQVLTNDGSVGSTYSQSQFRTKMNTGSFVSAASTKVPTMLQAIIGKLDVESGETAVLVSDMKYSPVGAAAPAVLMRQYSTDISKILSRFGYSASLVCAVSDYLDKKGNAVCERSPYYYLILGKAENVAYVRNDISAMLEINGHYVDNIDSGFSYGHAKYSFGIPNMCVQLDDEPSFLNYEETAYSDTCTIRLKLSLEDYRWIMVDENVFKSSFSASSLYGSEIQVGDVKIDVRNITGQSHELSRKATVAVDLKIFNMPADSDVIEWNLDIPTTLIAGMSEFLIDANEENDPAKSFSVGDFVKGMFQNGLGNTDMNPNYILVSKKH